MKNLSEIYRSIQSELKATDALFVRELALRRDGLLGEMTRYVSGMPGKRLRPALALFGARVVAPAAKKSAITAKATRLAAAVEMIHTATLLHDDVIDGATLRRGLLTLNAKWGDTLSVLSGDYLYSKAFCLLSELENQTVLRLMSDTARIVCEGEVAQIQHQYNVELSRADYVKIIEWKTASLMGAAAQSGALLAGASPERAKRLGDFGRNFGLAFQIVDDTQDLMGDEDLLGKSLGTDVGQGQLTLPLLYLKETGSAEVQARIAHWFSNGHGNGNGSSSANGNGHTALASATAATTTETQEQVRFLKQQALKYEVPAFCYKVAHQYLARARRALAPFLASPYKASLLALTDYLLR